MAEEADLWDHGGEVAPSLIGELPQGNGERSIEELLLQAANEPLGIDELQLLLDSAVRRPQAPAGWSTSPAGDRDDDLGESPARHADPVPDAFPENEPPPERTEAPGPAEEDLGDLSDDLDDLLDGLLDADEPGERRPGGSG
ncbi:hypothetical protein [Actinomadura harenae]|uniref:hypothetical protein n=1 Tax=Actinomadura harenae TaxID=2483351 RepID=UPI0013159445|nr:hypothetical protein [Actinomadura harenae]